MSNALSRAFAAVSLVIVFGVPAIGQQGQQRPALTAEDYARAERFLAPGVTPLVVGGSVTASWLPDDRFWYRNQIAGGHEFILVDPAKKTRARAFDHEKVAAALASASSSKVDPLNMNLQALTPAADGRSVAFNLSGRRWSCDVDGTKCADTGAAAASSEPEPPVGGRGGRGGGRGGAAGRSSSDGKPLNMAPDGKRGIFIRDWNLWVHDVATKQERQLTTDGVKYFGYATDNAGWSSSDRAIALWSPDSRKIATQQQDEREVGEMYFVNTVPGHPTLRVSKYPLPGDKVMAMLHRVIIDVDSGKTLRLQMDPDFHRGTISDNINVRDYNWSPDGSKLALASVSRDHKQVWLRVADAATGAVRTVLEEKVATHYESRTGWQVLWGTNELIWYSERNDWGNLYLYDLNTGALKHPITTGEGPVTQIERVDEKARTLWYGANGREKGRDPYFTHYYRISLDGAGPARAAVTVTPDEGVHDVQVAPSGRYVIDTVSKADVAPVVTLRDADGRLVMPLEKADISKLTATGWKPPTPITMKAADGKTDIYGLMFTPSTLDPSKKYPIVNQVYPGPQTGSTGSRAFTAARGDRQALAELGFVVVTIDGRGTPGRSKSFMDAYYGRMGRDNTIPDQVAGMRDLAKRYPYIDLDRVGIWGHSGGGFATTSAMFRFPDFFKVGIAESGNHDQRNYEDDWGERYQGLLVKDGEGDSYDVEANQNFAKDLKGKLMLAHGTMDTNVPPSQTLLVVEALIKANKDFDLVMLPNQAHGYATMGPYMMRRRWDYFVKWLLNTEPPHEYKMRP